MFAYTCISKMSQERANRGNISNLRRRRRCLILFCLLLQLPSSVGWRFRLPRLRGRDRRRDHVPVNYNGDVCEIDPFVDIVPATMEGPTKGSSSKVLWPSSHGDDNYEDAVLAFFKRLSSSMRVPDPVIEFWHRAKAILLYKPPVGIAAVFVAFRLVYTGRIFSLHRRNRYNAKRLSAEGMLQQAESSTLDKRRVRPSRALCLDKDDFSYDSYGGVQRIRRKLCWAVLHGILQDDHHDEEDTRHDGEYQQRRKSRVGTSSSIDTTNAIPLALEALHATHRPGSPRANFVEEVALPLSQLEAHLTSAIKTPPAATTDPGLSDADVVVQMSAKVAEIRALDALLRLTRDRLLVTSSRLARTVQHWRRRVLVQRALAVWFLQLFGKTSEGHQLVLSVVQAAYDAEISRLGAVQKVLMDRPEEMSDGDLLRILSAGDDSGKKAPLPSRVQRSTDFKRKRKGIKFSLPELSKYAIRWNAEGRGRLSLRVFDDYQTLSSDAAWESLFQNNGDPRQWIEGAHIWTMEARRVLCNVLRETLDTCTEDTSSSRGDMAMVEDWCLCSYEGLNGLDLEKRWAAVLGLVESLDMHRRMGEGRTIRMDTGLGFWAGRIDLCGIPSSLASVGLALLVHNRLLPHWPDFKLAALELISITWTIIEKRFWKPFYGIFQGLISKKSSGLLDAFDVGNEETSLDNMLRDLGLGDGTPETRRAGMQGAARAYENDMDNGVLRSALRGNLIRLLLVQVQQLKAGLLHALASIDVLVDANKLNLQILTAIPSVLIIIFGSRLFIRSLVTVRTKDLRSLEDVHGEMAQFLDEMEKSLIMSNSPLSPLAANDTDASVSVLQPKQLGQYVLHIHLYLVLLDYCSPPVPFRTCESIQKSMQDLLSMQGSSAMDAQVALVHVLRQQHNDLIKFL